MLYKYCIFLVLILIVATEAFLTIYSQAKKNKLNYFVVTSQTSSDAKLIEMNRIVNF